MKLRKRRLFIFFVIIFISLILLYINEWLGYHKQSETVKSSVSYEIGKEIKDINTLFHEIDGENTELNFNKVLMDISTVKVILNISKYGKNISKAESDNIDELMVFHEYFKEEILMMILTYYKDGELSVEQLSDLEILNNMFGEILNLEEESIKSFNSWNSLFYLMRMSELLLTK